MILLRTVPILFLIYLLSFFAPITYGQTPSAVKPGNSTGSFALSSFETINPYSGNLNFSLPVLSVGGRGTASSSVRLTINQKWIGKYWYLPDNPSGVPYVDDYYANELGENLVFDDGYGPGYLTSQHISLFGQHENPCPYNGGVYLYSKTLVKLTFVAPDGTQYTFRDRATHGQPYDRGFCDFTPYSRGTVFESDDGSSAVFISDQPIYDAIYEGDQPSLYASATSGVVILADGTKFGVGPHVIWQRDRNGNQISYTYSNVGGSVKITSIKDSLDREVTIEYGVQDVAPYGLCDRITYKGFGGASRIVRVSYDSLSNILRSDYSIRTRAQLFPDIGYATGSNCYPYGSPSQCGDYVTNPVKKSALWLPDGRSYKFRYNSHAELARVELPTGGVIEYDWTNGYNVGDAVINGITEIPSGERFDIYRRVVERRLYSDGIHLDNKLTISGTNSWGGTNRGYVVEDLFDSDNILKSRTKHYYEGIGGTGTFDTASLFYESWKNGREWQTDLIDGDGSTLLRRTTNTWSQSSPGWFTGYEWDSPSNNPHLVQTTTLLADSDQASSRTFSYDSRNNLIDTYEYDYGNGAAGAFLRRTHTDYLSTNPVNNVDYTNDSLHILNLPSQTWVSSDINGNNKVSRTSYEYDNYSSDSTHAPLVDRSSITGHDTNYSTSFTTRGNLTKVTRFANAPDQTGAVSIYSQYDIAGSVVKTIDANGNAATISYNDNFGSPDAEARTNSAPTLLNGQQTYAFPTSATNPLGFTAYTQVDYSTGALVDAEDINGNVGTTFYDDILDRPTQSISANNRSAFRRQSTITYDDTNRKVTVTSDSKNFDDNLAKVESIYDKLGRTIESRSYESGSNYIAALTEYDSLGRAYRSSNPYRPYLNEQPEWTTTTFDSLGRVIQIKTPDNAIVTRSYVGSTTTVTDQAGRKRSGTSDALGRLLHVNEDPSGVNYQTDYVYDVLGRLRKTTQTEGQTTQNRYFMYDDLGRLIRAKQVEQGVNPALNVSDPVTGNNGWSVAYAYDSNSNITSTTDALNRTITGTYDDLNRLTFRNYSDSTPDVTFTFDDSNIPNSRGQLTAVITSVSSTFYTAFDQLGRVKSSQQITNGQAYNFPDYSYDLSGALVSQTYPSGRIVSTETDDIGRLSKVTSQLPNQVARTYLSNLSYTPFGAVKYARLGNGKWESAEYDPKRLQLTQIGLGGSAGDTSLLKLEYSFGSTNNNGSLLQQKITIPGAVNPIVQDYVYDSLNRLQSATETVSSQVSWKQTFQYDRFGNRRFDAANTTTLGTCSQAVCNPNIDLARNQLSASDGYNFDNEGNLTANPESQLLAYDAENHLTQVQNTATQTVANYYYDGLGKRVRKVSGAQETVFVHDAFGKLVAEYSTEIPQDPKIAYLTADSLGSPRIATNAIGQVISRHDYMPFGEEVTAGTGGRTTAQGYGGVDGVRQQFTGYERDDESGLDYAQARYFSSKHGRFTGVDPLAASANAKNPQSLNRYSYALNSPYKFSDPLGLFPLCHGPGTGNGAEHSCDGNDENGFPKRDRSATDLKGGSESSQIWEAQDREIRESQTTPPGHEADGMGGQDGLEVEAATSTSVTVVGEAESCCDDDDAWILPPLVQNPEDLVGKPPVKEQGQKQVECVALCKIYGNLPKTTTWRKGAGVFGNRRIRAGTLIATFDGDGLYRSKEHDNHAAIYLSQDEGGIWVIDQWQGLKAIQKRYIALKPGMSDPSNNARAFSIIALAVKVKDGVPVAYVGYDGATFKY